LKNNQKIYSGLVIISAITTIIMGVLYFKHIIALDIVMLFMGLTQLFSGLSQINLTKSMELKENNKATKSIGILTIILGLTIIVAVLIKMIS
jgi:uncharacterized membrane protein HdeD (DUF308 family)